MNWLDFFRKKEEPETAKEKPLSAKTCPKCKKKDKVVSIVYGLPCESAFKEARNNKIRLGGCCINPDSPKYYCERCGKNFGKLPN